MNGILLSEITDSSHSLTFDGLKQILSDMADILSNVIDFLNPYLPFIAGFFVGMTFGIIMSCIILSAYPERINR